VNDYAGVLDSSSEQTIRDLFQQLKNDSGIEAVVVTVNSIQDYSTGASTIESFATNLFNSWGIGSWQEDNGILILVAVKDRGCRIEMGAGYGHQYDSAMQHVIDEHMLPYFRSGDYQTGILEGSRSVIDNVAGSVASNIAGTVTGAVGSKHYVFWNSSEEFVSWLSKYKVEIIAAALALIAISIVLRLILRPLFRSVSSRGDYHDGYSSGGSGGGGSGGGSSGGGGASGKW
jgi:uncharacterized protein